MNKTVKARDGYYEALGSMYDQLKAGDNLQAWANLVIEPIKQWCPNARHLLDLGCGTGKSSQAFAARGFDVVGCDNSPAMLDVARTASPDVTFIDADIRSLPDALHASFDVVNFMGDVPNHLLHEDDLTATLRSARKTLRAGGVIAFDVNTIAAYEEFFTRHHIIERPDSTFLWIGETTDLVPDALASMRLIAFHQQSDHWTRVDTSLTQRHYSTETLNRVIRDAGLTLRARYALERGTLVTPADETCHTKIIYILQAPDNP